MKKAKIMLSAIAVFAVVGGALAFKAKKGDTIFCSTTTSNLPLCIKFEQSTWNIVTGGVSYCTIQDSGSSKCDIQGYPPVKNF